MIRIIPLFLTALILLFGVLCKGVKTAGDLLRPNETVLVKTECPCCCSEIVVKFFDAWAYGPHSISIYREAEGKTKRIASTKIANDGVIPNHRNYELEWKKCSLQLILKGCEQKNDTLIIACDKKKNTKK